MESKAHIAYLGAKEGNHPLYPETAARQRERNRDSASFSGDDAAAVRCRTPRLTGALCGTPGPASASAPDPATHWHSDDCPDLTRTGRPPGKCQAEATAVSSIRNCLYSCA